MINNEFCKLQLEALNKGEVLIHASAVCRDIISVNWRGDEIKYLGTESIIFCGPTESGKTRYMLEFCKKGWKCLGDDFVRIQDGYIYGCFLEGCHMKYESGFRIPIRKHPLYWFYKAVRLFTNRKPHIFLTPKELGFKVAFKAKLDKIIFLEGVYGKNIAEKIYNNTKTKGDFDLYENGNYLFLLSTIIEENLNEDTTFETTIDTARQL